mgnify:CR=1 FL=1
MMDGWIMISAVAVMISALLAAIMIMASRLMQLPDLEQWAKSELVFSLSTVFVLLFLISIIEFAEPLLVDIIREMTEFNFGQQSGQIPVLPPGEEATLMDYALAYMHSVFSCIKSLFKFLLKLNFPLELAASFSVDVFMFDAVGGWVYKGPVQTIKNIANYITFTLFIYYLFIHIMRFLEATALTIFIPLGIILRQFPPTRGSGAFIISFAIGFYIVFPLAYLLVVNVVPQTFACPVLPEFEHLDDLAAYGMGNTHTASDMLLWSDAHQSGVWNTLSGIGGYLAGFELDSFDVIPDAVEFTAGRVAGFSINLCCLPFLAMIITMSFILSSTNLFGANLPEIGRGFIKLI